MTSLKALYKQHEKITREIDSRIKAMIIKFCDANDYKYWTYCISKTMMFQSAHGNDISNKKTERFLKLINEFIDNVGSWDGQFSYDPAMYRENKYRDFYMEELKALKRIAKKL